jgi:hypothetical protein
MTESLLEVARRVAPPDWTVSVEWNGSEWEAKALSRRDVTTRLAAYGLTPDSAVASLVALLELRRKAA